MALQPTNLIIQGSQLPATFVGKPNDLFQAMLERMRIVSPTGISFFVTGDTEPPNNQGPWLKGGVQWWVFDPDLKRYVPLDVSESETKWFFMGSTTPPGTNPPVWLKTDGTPSEASPNAFGNPVAWFVYNGTTWVRLPTIIDDRSIVQAKLDFKANFFGTASGTNNYSITFSPGGPFHYGNGTTEAFFCLIKFTNANTGAVTLSVDGGGGAPVKKNVTEEIEPGEIAAGSVHALIFDGTNFQILSPLFSTEVIPASVGGIAPSENLIITNDATTPDDIVQVTANSVVLSKTTGEKFQANTVINEIDITASGLGGLDTGASVVDTWYYIWLVSNGTNVAGVFSTSNITPTVPSDYVFLALLGAIYNDSSNDLTKIWQTGRKVFIVSATFASIVGPGLQSIATEVPTIAKTVFGTATVSNAAGNGSGTLQLSGDADGRGLQTILGIVAGTFPQNSSYFHVPLITPQNIYETRTFAGPAWDLSLAGYTL